jgi:AcrR family transcriptional regulator
LTLAQETHDRIVLAASRLFHARGFAATSVAQILAEAGAAVSSFYHHFDAKEDLVVAVLDHHLERLQAEVIEPVCRVVGDPVERAFAILGAGGTFLQATECRLGCPVGNLAGELSDTHEPVRRKLDAVFGVWRDAIARCLREAEPRLPREVDAEQLAILFLSAMEGAVMQARVARSLRPFEVTVRLLRDHVDRLLAARHASKPIGVP